MDTSLLIDPEAIARIRSLESVRPGILHKLTDMFIQNTEGHLSRLPELIQHNSHDELIVLFHTLKGSAANIGANRLSHAAGEGETLCKASPLNQEELLGVADQILDLFAETRQALVQL
jgi:HPt (histidine-containing phosphotransfer) domain-containing protein